MTNEQTGVDLMRRPRRRRPRRIWRWEGVVDEMDARSLWTFLVPVDHEGPEVVAEFERAHLPDAQPGTLFNLYIHRRGRKTRTVLRERRLPPWTAEELAEVRERAGLLARRLQDLVA